MVDFKFVGSGVGSLVWERSGTTGRTKAGVDDVEMNLGDAAGANAVYVKDSGGNSKLKADSLGRLQFDPVGNGSILKMGLFNQLEVRNNLDTAYRSLRALSCLATTLLCQTLQEGFGTTNLFFKTNGAAFGFEFLDNTGASLAEIDNDGNFSQKSPTYGGAFALKKYEGLVDLSGATQITLNIPINVVILGVAFVVKTAITGSGGLTDWSAAFSGGSTLPIVSTQALAKNTKAKKANAGIETTATTQIQISANGVETFSAGEIVAVALVREITDLDSFA